jgi:hypothetical protein
MHSGTRQDDPLKAYYKTYHLTQANMSRICQLQSRNEPGRRMMIQQLAELDACCDLIIRKRAHGPMATLGYWLPHIFHEAGHLKGMISLPDHNSRAEYCSVKHIDFR